VEMRALAPRDRGAKGADPLVPPSEGVAASRLSGVRFAGDMNPTVARRTPTRKVLVCSTFLLTITRLQGRDFATLRPVEDASREASTLGPRFGQWGPSRVRSRAARARREPAPGPGGPLRPRARRALARHAQSHACPRAAGGRSAWTCSSGSARLEVLREPTGPPSAGEPQRTMSPPRSRWRGAIHPEPGAQAKITGCGITRSSKLLRRSLYRAPIARPGRAMAAG
jgi:hypothetical protein